MHTPWRSKPDRAEAGKAGPEALLRTGRRRAGMGAKTGEHVLDRLCVRQDIDEAALAEEKRVDLVGIECRGNVDASEGDAVVARTGGKQAVAAVFLLCLLYTSDAANP